MIITITGIPGAGKSVISRMLSKELGYRIYSVGEMRGDIAMEMGLTIDELNELGKKEEWVHRKVDERIEKVGKEEDNIIVDGWAAYHFIPNSFKIFIKCDWDEAARRVFSDQKERKDEREYKSVRDAKKVIQKRFEVSWESYRKLYGMVLDEKAFDIVVDTTNMKKEETLSMIMDAIRMKEKE